MITEAIKRDVLMLKEMEKIQLIELLYESLGKRDDKIEKEWAKESDRRLAAYEKGEIEAKDVKTVINALRK
ncbi:addiction module protein [candidate division KSB1 bacterium]|nr:addiction module protein [candidate division KSB1 bacterium]